jgi:hypothetical protein
MSGELIPRSGGEASRVLRGSDPLARRLPREIQRGIDRESAWGLINAARAQAAGFVADARIDAVELVAERAMLALDRLNHVEAAMAKQDPIQAARFAGLVDDFLLVARSEIRNLPREF